MKEIWSYIKSRQGSFLIAGDLLMLYGVIGLNWSVLRIISLFWLDTIIMTWFLMLLLKKLYDASFAFIIPATVIVGSVLVGLYFEIFRMCSRTEHMEPFDYLFAFRPYYETSGILIAIVCGHFFECRFFIGLVKEKPDQSINYFYVFMGRFLAICFVMFVIAILTEMPNYRSHIMVPMVILVSLKEIMEFYIYRMYKKKLTLEEENKMPMI